MAQQRINPLLDEEDENETENDQIPYDSISDITETPDFMELQNEGVSGGGDNSSIIKEFMAKRGQGGPSALGYEDELGRLDDLRKTSLKSNAIANIGQSFAQIAQGSNKPEPSPVFQNIASQSQDLLSLQEKDLDRKQRLFNTIQNRLGRQKATEASLKLKEAVLKSRGMTSGNSNQNQTSRLLNTLVDKVDDDPVIKGGLLTKAALEKAVRVLEDTSVELTPQLLADVEQDIASGLSSKSGAVTEGKLKRTEFDAVQRDYANALQRLTGTPQDLRTQMPEIVGHVHKLAKGLLRDYAVSISKRANSKLDEYSSVHEHNPEYVQAINRLRKNYDPPPESPEAKQGIPKSAEQNASPQIGPHGKTVEQNGMVFEWDGKKYVPQGSP